MVKSYHPHGDSDFQFLANVGATLAPPAALAFGGYHAAKRLRDLGASSWPYYGTPSRKLPPDVVSWVDKYDVPNRPFGVSRVHRGHFERYSRRFRTGTTRRYKVYLKRRYKRAVLRTMH